MEDSKLSNISGLTGAVNRIPQQIDSFISEVRKETTDIKKDSSYYLKMHKGGMVICLISIVCGFLVIASAVAHLKMPIAFMDTVIDSLGQYKVWIGLLLVILGIHGIARSVYGSSLDRADEKMENILSGAKDQYEKEILRSPVESFIDKINRQEDCEVTAGTAPGEQARKFFVSLSQAKQRTEKLVQISRIIIPALLFIAVLKGLHDVSDSLSASFFVEINAPQSASRYFGLLFLLMMVFNRRLALLLEFVTGKKGGIRALMCIPSLIYGILLYRDLGNYYFQQLIPVNATSSIVQQLAGIPFIVTALEVLCLILSLVTIDPYREREILNPVRAANRDSTSTMAVETSGWGIYLRVLLQYLLFGAFLFVGTFLQGITDSMASAIILGLITGFFWRIISLLWPVGKMHIAAKFLGTRYSVVLDFFVLLLFFLPWLLEGQFLSTYCLIYFITFEVASWIVFAIIRAVGQ